MLDSTHRLIILDRDGVINHDAPDYVKTPDEWRPIAGSLEAMAMLYHAGWRIAIASNQSAIGRGLMTTDALYEVYMKMQGILSGLGARVEGLFFCPHVPAVHCRCRKPNPGLLEQIAHRFKTELVDVPFVGDTLKDINAAAAVGARPMLVLTGQGRQTADDPRCPADIKRYADLAAVADRLLDQA